MGGKQSGLELTIGVSIRQVGDGGFPQGLELTETLQLTAGDFLEMSKILGQFHDLAECVRVRQGARK